MTSTEETKTKRAAEVAHTQAMTIRTLNDVGRFTTNSIIKAVTSNNLSLLELRNQSSSKITIH